MTDEEMAYEYAKYDDNGRVSVNDDKFKGFLAGLKEGRQKWHDLRKDPNDLPPMIQDERHISNRVWVHVKNWGTEYGHYDYNKNFWVIRCRIVNLPILGWIEIPELEV